MLQAVILDVVENEFRLQPDPTNPDEGLCGPPRVTLPGNRPDNRLRWRRCVTEKSRELLSAGLDPGAAVEDACDFVLIYRVPRIQSALQWAERFQTYVLEDFLHNTEVARQYVLSESSIPRTKILTDPVESGDNRSEFG